jgi:hypothetical protein
MLISSMFSSCSQNGLDGSTPSTSAIAIGGASCGSSILYNQPTNGVFRASQQTQHYSGELKASIKAPKKHK